MAEKKHKPDVKWLWGSKAVRDIIEQVMAGKVKGCRGYRVTARIPFLRYIPLWKITWP